MRFILALILGGMFAALAADPAAAQAGFDRPGGDYLRFTVPSGEPAICASRCERDNRCRAWSFSYPRTAGVSAICWMKNEVKRRVADPCCVSGVRGSGVVEPRIDTTEFSFDRAGGDYRSFEMPPDPQGAPCLAACKADGRCRAWTYMRPGYAGAGTRCYLKDRIKPPRHMPCCISGVVR